MKNGRRRGTAPRPYEPFWLFCLPCRHLVVPFRPRAVCCWHPAHSGSAGVRHHRWLAAITVRSAVVSPKPLYPRTSPPEVPCHHSITWQLFMRYSYCKTPPSPRRAKLQPNRGPKSVPEPYFGRPTPLATYRLRGVRVSPLSAGGEGLCKARSRLLNRPGKLAEGIQQQLGLFSCHCSTCSGHYLLHTLSGSVPWGNRFRLWKFKYRVVRFKKKRSRKSDVGTVSGSHRQFAVVIRGQYSTVDTWAPGRPPPCRAAPAGFRQAGAVSTTDFSFQLHSRAWDGSCTGTTWHRALPTPRFSCGKEGLDKGSTPSLPTRSYLVPGKNCLVSGRSAPSRHGSALSRTQTPSPRGDPEGGDGPAKDDDPQRRPHVGFLVGRAQGVPRVQRL